MKATPVDVSSSQVGRSSSDGEAINALMGRLAGEDINWGYSKRVGEWATLGSTVSEPPSLIS